MRAVYLDRSRAAAPDFIRSSRRATALRSPCAELSLRLLVDQGSVTVFAGQGEVVLTDQIFPGPDSNGITFFSEGGQARVADLNIWTMKSIWPPGTINEDISRLDWLDSRSDPVQEMTGAVPQPTEAGRRASHQVPEVAASIGRKNGLGRDPHQQ